MREDFWFTKIIPKASPVPKIVKAIKNSDRTKELFALIFNYLYTLGIWLINKLSFIILIK